MSSIGAPGVNPNAGVSTSAGPIEQTGFVGDSQTQSKSNVGLWGGSNWWRRNTQAIVTHPCPLVPALDPTGTTTSVTGDAQQTNLPFKEQVKGYAKLTAGHVFHNKGEVELGKAKLQGKLD
jgi:hypothetical protein